MFNTPFVRTPTSDGGLTQYDHLDPIEAIVLSWRIPGNNPNHHYIMCQTVRNLMPVLGRSLDRLAQIESEE